jgi:hypothetical protein
MQRAMQQARKYAADFTIGKAGIISDLSVVVGDECIEYRRKQSDLLLVYNGNWRYYSTATTSGWKKGRTRIIRFTPQPVRI